MELYTPCAGTRPGAADIEEGRALGTAAPDVKDLGARDLDGLGRVL